MELHSSPYSGGELSSAEEDPTPLDLQRREGCGASVAQTRQVYTKESGLVAARLQLLDHELGHPRPEISFSYRPEEYHELECAFHRLLQTNDGRG